MAAIVGDLHSVPGRFAVVAARFNSLVVDRLLAGAIDALRRHGVAEADIDIAHVPGALELPIVADRFARGGRHAAVIAVGAVVRGDTSHFDVVVGQSAAGLAHVALATGVPVANAVLTTDTMEQALDRAGGKAGNKGAEAALAALETASLLRRLDGHLADLPAAPRGMGFRGSRTDIREGT